MLTYKVLNVTTSLVILGTPDGKTLKFSPSDFDFSVRKGMELEMYKSETGKRYFVEHESHKTSNLTKPTPHTPQMIRTPRNAGLAIFLTFIAGPIGLLYASVRDALVLILINIVLFVFFFLATIGSVTAKIHDPAGSSSSGVAVFMSLMTIIIPLTTWIASMILAYKDVKSYNSGGSGHTL